MSPRSRRSFIARQKKALYTIPRNVTAANRQGIDVCDVENERLVEHRMIGGNGSILAGETYPFCLDTAQRE